MVGRSIAVQTDGKILAGGMFNVIGGQTAVIFARLTNDTAALQNLAVTQTTITWTRGGSSPQLTRVTFEYSTDNVNYTPLGNGIPQSGSSNWILTGLSLPTGQNIYIRARGYYRSGYDNGSESITESVRNAVSRGWRHVRGLPSEDDHSGSPMRQFGIPKTSRSRRPADACPHNAIGKEDGPAKRVTSSATPLAIFGRGSVFELTTPNLRSSRQVQMSR